MTFQCGPIILHLGPTEIEKQTARKIVENTLNKRTKPVKFTWEGAANLLATMSNTPLRNYQIIFPNMNPYSSPIMEKIKSVCGVGRRWFFSVLFPNPDPNQPPLLILNSA